MTQKNYVDALIVSVNKLFEKTAVKAIKTDKTLNIPMICNFQEEAQNLRNISYSSMKRAIWKLLLQKSRATEGVEFIEQK